MKNTIVRLMTVTLAIAMILPLVSCGNSHTIKGGESRITEAQSTVDIGGIDSFGSTNGTKSEEDTESPQGGSGETSAAGTTRQAQANSKTSSTSKTPSTASHTRTGPKSSSAANNSSTTASVTWTYKNGGDGYIIKSDGKSSVKIPIDMAHLSPLR